MPKKSPILVTGTGISPKVLCSRSDEIYRIFGLTPNDFTVNYDTFLKAIHPEDRSRVADAIEKSLADSSVSYYIEHRISLPSGEARLVHEQAEITRDSNGTPRYI